MRTGLRDADLSCRDVVAERVNSRAQATVAAAGAAGGSDTGGAAATGEMADEAGGLAHASLGHGLGEGGGHNGLNRNTALRKQLQVLFELRVQLGEGCGR